MAGGRHPGWGTANRIVPLGDAYLELVAVVDEREARESFFGRWITRAVADGGGPVAWAVRPDELEATAARLGLEIGAGSRTTRSGDRVEWRMAGIGEAASRPWLPFFIEWRDPARFPGAGATPVAAVTRLVLEGDADELSTWLGDHSLPLDVRPGESGIMAVVLDAPRGAVTLDREAL